jgi:hypothetical protein
MTGITNTAAEMAKAAGERLVMAASIEDSPQTVGRIHAEI